MHEHLERQRARRRVVPDLGDRQLDGQVRTAIDALQAVLTEVPTDFPDRNQQVNRFLPPLAASVHAIMREQQIEIPYSSRVEHIAAGGVARYPDIVTMSLDEIAAEFDGLCSQPGHG